MAEARLCPSSALFCGSLLLACISPVGASSCSDLSRFPLSCTSKLSSEGKRRGTRGRRGSSSLGLASRLSVDRSSGSGRLCRSTKHSLDLDRGRGRRSQLARRRRRSRRSRASRLADASAPQTRSCDLEMGPGSRRLAGTGRSAGRLSRLSGDLQDRRRGRGARGKHSRLSGGASPLELLRWRKAGLGGATSETCVSCSSSRLSSASIEFSEKLLCRSSGPFVAIAPLELDRRGGLRFFGRTLMRCRAAVWLSWPVLDSAVTHSVNNFTSP